MGELHLYIDNSPESREAKQLVEQSGLDCLIFEAGIHFPALSDQGNKELPVLYSPEGRDQGIKHIKRFLQIHGGRK